MGKSYYRFGKKQYKTVDIVVERFELQVFPPVTNAFTILDPDVGGETD